jgi:iron complex transport system substrate-binding protein
MKIKHILTGLISILLWGSSLQAAITITDAVDRTRTFEKPIQRVYPTSPISAIYTYTLAPEMLVGWNYQPSKFELSHMLPEIQQLPIVGGWFGKKGTANLETLLATKPDVILSVGTLKKADIDFANQLEKQTGIPVLLADLSLDQCETVYEMLGKLFNREEKAKELSDYCNKTFTDMQKLADSLSEEEKIHFYYAEGIKGLETDPASSMHTETFLRVGGINVCDLADQPNKCGRAIVSMEQVMLWKPQVVFIGLDRGGDNTKAPEWLSDDLWKRLDAVKNHRVYQIPNTPFNWVDRPPSVSRILGLRWAFWCLYPKKVDYDMAEETQKFFKLFYHYEMSSTEAKEMLQHSKVLP